MANTRDMSEEKIIEEDKSDLEDDEELVFEWQNIVKRLSINIFQHYFDDTLFSP